MPDKSGKHSGEHGAANVAFGRLIRLSSVAPDPASVEELELGLLTVKAMSPEDQRAMVDNAYGGRRG